MDRGRGTAETAMTFVGRPFDAALSLSNQEAIYCTELIFISMRQAGIRLEVPLRKLPLSEPVLMPYDLQRAFST